MAVGRTVTNGSLTLNGHTLTVAMADTTNPIFSILDHVTVTPGNIVVATPPSGKFSGLDIEFGAQVGTGVNITYQPGTYGEFFQNSANSVTAPLTFQGGNIFGPGTAVQAQVDSNITLHGNVSIEPMSNGLPNLTLNQPLLLTGTITDNGGGFGMTINGPGTITLAGTNSYSGSTVVSAGTLVYSGNDIAPHASKLVLGGATFSTGGHNQTMKSLTVSNSSATALATIDMGTNNTGSILHFGNSSLAPWSSLSSPELTINNWVGNATDPSLGGGPDQIFFGTNGYSGLSRAQLNSIQFPSEPQGAILLSDGELVPNVSGNALTVPMLGDWNGDGVTSVADVSAAMTALSNLNAYEANKMLSDGDVVALGDFNGDGVVTNADLQGLISFLANGNGGGTLQAVPEPASIMLWIAGTMALAFLGRSKVNASIVRQEIS
jgi:fibronectin-binding autotransporter adhesin